MNRNAFYRCNPLMSRREYLARVAAAPLAAAGYCLAQEPVATGTVDVHHHFYAPVLKPFVEPSASIRAMLNYSSAKSIEDMDAAGVQVAFLSTRFWLNDDPSSQKKAFTAAAREMNEYGTKLGSDNKGRFGLLAMLPMLDIDATLREIEYAFDTLKASGVAVTSSYGNRFLGDPVFQPVFDELNRRGAVVHVHPTDGPCCHDVIPGTSPTVIEYQTDTARALWTVIQERPERPISVATRCPDVRFIWSHAGGTLLGLLGRFVREWDSIASPPKNSRLYHLKRFYYDTAASENPIQMQALKNLCGITQLQFGSDYPFGSGTAYRIRVAALRNCGFSSHELRAVLGENSRTILRIRT